MGKLQQWSYNDDYILWSTAKEKTDTMRQKWKDTILLNESTSFNQTKSEVIHLLIVTALSSLS